MPMASHSAGRSAITADKSGLEWDAALVAMGGAGRRGGAACGEKERRPARARQRMGGGGKRLGQALLLIY